MQQGLRLLAKVSLGNGRLSPLASKPMGATGVQLLAGKSLDSLALSKFRP